MAKAIRASFLRERILRRKFKAIQSPCLLFSQIVSFTMHASIRRIPSGQNIYYAFHSETYHSADANTIFQHAGASDNFGYSGS